jgi:hypothetical protein
MDLSIRLNRLDPSYQLRQTLLVVLEPTLQVLLAQSIQRLPVVLEVLADLLVLSYQSDQTLPGVLVVPALQLLL